MADFSKYFPGVGDYFYGSPEQQAAESEKRRQQWEEIKSSPQYQNLRAMSDRRMYLDGVPVDPREMRLAMTQDTLRPGPSSDYYRHAREMPGKAYSAVFEAGMRPRDTLIKAAQAASDGDYGEAAMLGMRAPLAAFYPPAAAGTPNSPDDWRDDARALGISTGNITAIDLLTDPETYMAVPLPFRAAGLAIRPLLRGAGVAGDLMRYGRGIPATLVDEAGNEIRRLKSAQPVRRQMKVEYAR